MGDLDDSFAQLLGRQPTDKQKQALYRVRDALKLKTTDAVWLLLMALQHYETLYEKFPALIAEAARDVTESVRATAEAQAKAARDETKKALAETVHETVDAVAKRRANAELFKWVSATVIATLLLDARGEVAETGREGRRSRGWREQGQASMRVRDHDVVLGAHARRTPRVRTREGRQPPRSGQLRRPRLGAEGRLVRRAERA